MKTVLLCYPPFEGKNYLASRSPFPIGPLYIAAYLQQHGIKAEVVDFSYPPRKRKTKRPKELKTGQSNYFRFGWTDLQIKKFLIENRRKYHNVIGVSSLMSSNWSGAYNLIKIIKSINAGKYQVVLGGPHATAFPFHVFKNSLADYVCFGEGEEAFLEFITGHSHEGIIGRQDRIIEGHTKTSFIQDMNSLPFPARNLLLDDRKTKSIYLTMSRGCPHRCSFCGSHLIQGRRWRHKSIEYAIDEINFYYKEWGVRKFIVEDDNPCPGKKGVKHLKKFCKAMIKKGPLVRFEISHGLPVYATANKKLCKLLFLTGFRHMAFPVESTDPEVLKDMNKTNVQKYWKKAVKNWTYQKHNPVQIILGYPFVETITTMLKTMVDISSERCLIWASHFRLNKSTDLYIRALRANYIGNDYDPINTQAFYLETERFTIKDLRELMQISRGLNYATEQGYNAIKESPDTKAFHSYRTPKKSGDVVAEGNFKFKRSQNIVASIRVKLRTNRPGRPMCSVNKEGTKIIYTSHKPSKVYDTLYELVTGRKVKKIQDYIRKK